MPETSKYGLIGKSLDHSFSAEYFRDKFEKEQISATYENVPLSSQGMIQDVLTSGKYHGLNVTIPYKEEVLTYVDECDEIVSAIGAANTLHFRNGKWKAYNTDAFGFRQSIKPFFRSHHERSIILGTGGASKAVAYVLENLGSDVIYISRNPKGQDQFAYEEMNAQMLASCKLIVNCTPVGTFPNIEESLSIPYEHIDAAHLCIDLIYNPKETLFLRQSKERGAVTINGETMLQQQAEKSWEIWNS